MNGSCIPWHIQSITHLLHLGADYMTNFSPVSRAEISPRLPEQIFLEGLNGGVALTVDG